MKSSSCVIFTAGDWCNLDTIRLHLQHHPTVLACDGALATCLEHGIVPDAVVGDMDSVDASVITRFVDLGGQVHRREEQDSHDLSKALVLAEELGHLSCLVVGATGGDRGHEWANLLTCAASSIDIECLGDHHTHRFFSHDKTHSIETRVGEKFSLFGMPNAEGITLSGAKYTLEKTTLRMGSLGLHNVAVSSTVNITYTAGRLMLLKHHPSVKVEERP